jgi:hypothetical protein
MSANAQVTDAQEEAARKAAARIAQLAQVLDPDSPVNSGVNFDEERRNRLTKNVRTEVSTFIESSIPASSNQEDIQTLLRVVMASMKPDMEYGELPKARTATLRNGRSLVASFTVVRPPHFDSSSIIGFREDRGSFRAVATAGQEDFDGYTMFTLDVPSPVDGELWIVVGGRAHTFNGLSKYRFRLYSFNGDVFRTIWSRDDVFNARLQVLPSGFALTHTDASTRAWTEVAEEYALTFNGVFKVK